MHEARRLKFINAIFVVFEVTDMRYPLSEQSSGFFVLSKFKGQALIHSFIGWLIVVQTVVQHITHDSFELVSIRAY